MNILEKIVADKRQWVAQSQARRPLSALLAAAKPSSRRFFAALGAQVRAQKTAVIAEFKRASPSQGAIVSKDFEPQRVAQAYQRAGATCLSVLTDAPYFQGSDSDFTAVREAVNLPMLRKDFTIDEYQIVEARVLGADAVLLIAAVLDDAQLADYQAVAHELGMDALIEVHSQAEFARAQNLAPAAIGVNNRDLRDFSVHLETSLALAAQLLPGQFLISESGITTPEDLARLQNSGIFAYLIGGALMKTPDPGRALAQLLNKENA